MNISVAMAVYNGEKYIEEQLDSIIKQLISGDEIVISYDSSNDKTLSIIEKYENKYDFISVYKNDEFKKGYVNNFINAFKNVKNEIIFYADQDDLWLEDKREKVTNIFIENPNVEFVAHDCINTDMFLNHNNLSYFQSRGYPSSFFKNIYRLRYIGCCTAFKSSFLKYALPLPLNNRSIDWSLGTLALARDSFYFINDILLLHRIHSSNTTPKKKLTLTEHLYIRFKILFYILKKV